MITVQAIRIYGSRSFQKDPTHAVAYELIAISLEKGKWQNIKHESYSDKENEEFDKIAAGYKFGIEINNIEYYSLHLNVHF